MSLARTALLRISDSRWMREHGVRAPFVRRAVSTFMPGETAADMLNAAAVQAAEGVGAVFTRLGENVLDMDEAQRVTDHYLAVIDDVRARRLACEPSIKLTQLGLDVDPDRAYANVLAIGRHADQAGNYLWVDMEQSPYVDRTLGVVRRLREEIPRLGVALQAYLHRTADDVAAMVARGIGIRLVKGAYSEPPAIAFPKKADVDANYVKLARLMLSPGARASGSRAVFGTHDTAIIRIIEQHGDAASLAPTDYEIHMLFGIQRGEQRRLARDRKNVRVLIAYGTYWFPWYMRRLAERPANVWFVARSIFR
jgi:proline dehydrogenase